MPELPPDPPESEEPRTISDQLMVLRSPEDPLSDQPMTFMSEEASSTHPSSKKPLRKTLKMKVKERKSTPAPPTKGAGRKRFVPSPMPEDKQLRKKIDFGAEGSSPVGSPKCKGPIFSKPMEPSPNPNGEDEPKSIEELGDAGTDGDTPADDPAAGVGTGAGDGDEHYCPHDGCLVRHGFSMGQKALVDALVNLPEMDTTTNSLSESSLAPCHSGTSRDAGPNATVEPPQKKN